MPENVARWNEPADLATRHGAGFSGGQDVYDSPDPVLRNLAGCPTVKVYYHLRELFPSAHGAFLQRRTVLLGKGWHVVAGEGPGGERNAEIFRAILGGVDSFETYLEELHETLWNGYGVGVVTSIQDLSAAGRTFQSPWFLRQKPPHHFSFTVDRRLAWTESQYGGFSPESVYNTNPELPNANGDLFRFLVSSVGTDDPYGLGIARFIYQVWRMWRGSMKDAATGLNRALGTLFIEDRGGGGSPAGKAGYTEGEAATISASLMATKQAYEATGILQFPPGITGKLVEASSFVGQAVEFLRYLDELATRVVLSVALTTTLDGEGSRAAAQVQLGPMIGLCRADGRKMQEWIETYFYRWVELAIGSQMREDEKPCFRFMLADATDKELLAVLIKAGIPIAAEPLAREAGVTLATDDPEELIISGGAPAPVPPEADEPADEKPEIEEGDEPEED